MVKALQPAKTKVPASKPQADSKTTGIKKPVKRPNISGKTFQKPSQPADSVPKEPRQSEISERTLKIKKSKDLKDEIKKFYQNISLDAKKENENVKNTIKEFLAYFKKNANTVGL